MFKPDLKKFISLLLCAVFISAFSGIMAQINLAPLATVTSSDCWNCPQANDQIILACGTQEMFVWTNNPATDYFQFEWNSPQSVNEVVIHHANTSARFLTGATIQAWNGSSFINVHTFSGLPQVCVNSVTFPAVTTTILRFTQLVPGTGQATNMNYREFELIQGVIGTDNAGVIAIDSPAGGCEGTYPVLARINNTGHNRINSVTVNWELNGNLQSPVLYNQLLDTLGGSGSNSGLVNLGTVTMIAGTTDEIKVWTSMPNGVPDMHNDNDTVNKISNNLTIITDFPYYEDYENGQAEWTASGTNSSWAFGTPAKSLITGTASGMNAFVTGGLGTSTYNIDEDSRVGSPCFDFSGFQGTPWVALDIWWDAEAGWDGAVLQSTTNGGASWENVGKVFDPNNWYTDNSLDLRPGGSTEGWSGSGTNGSGGWVRAKHKLNPALVGKEVRFRVAFGSDGSGQFDGVAFDNFTLVDFREVNLGPDRSMCQKPNLELTPGIPINGKIEWSNGQTGGTTVVTSTGTYWVKYTDTLIDESSFDAIDILMSTPPSINFHADTQFVALPDVITLDPRLPFDLDYHWSPDNSTLPFYLFKGSQFGLGSHLVTLKVTDSLLCTDEKTIAVEVINITGINEHNERLISLYPNPVDAMLYVSIQNPTTNQADIRLIDLQGKMVFSDVYALSGSSQLEIDMNNLPAGSYMLLVREGGNVITKKLIKQ